MSGFLLLLLLSALRWCDSAKILTAGLFPTVSHQAPLRTISLELSKRGHDVTFITTDPLKKTIANYTEVDISAAYKHTRSSFDWIAMAHWTSKMFDFKAKRIGHTVCQADLNTPELQNFIKSAPKFDLVIIERLIMPCLYGLIHAVGSPPAIGYVSMSANVNTQHAIGNPTHPAYLPDWTLPYTSTDHMSFWQRLHSTYLWLQWMYNWYCEILPDQEEIQRKYFGLDAPSVFEVDTNFSLTLLHNHFTVNYPRPNLPSVIELTGLHVEHKPKPLPKDIQEWLDGAENGVVYFSLGCTVQASTMPEEKRRALLEGFSKIPQRVLWKWEADMTDLPPNVRVFKWLPQQSVLAHPNVLLFITQGGLQSVNEATYHGVPMLGIPFVADQPQNIGKLVSVGVTRELRFTDITKDTFVDAIRTTIEDESYRVNMKRFSALYREHQATSLPRAIWWVEYVLRHQGAPHLRSAALDLRLYQLLMIDVVSFVVVITAGFFVTSYILLRFLMSKIYRTRKLKTH